MSVRLKLFFRNGLVTSFRSFLTGLALLLIDRCLAFSGLCELLGGGDSVGGGNEEGGGRERGMRWGMERREGRVLRGGGG